MIELATPDDDDSALAAMAKLSADLKKASRELTHGQARYAVDTYYQLQHLRIGAAHQSEAAKKAQEPTGFLNWFGPLSKKLEAVMKGALNEYSDSVTVGRWSKSIVGIGPVIAAGLIAHIDITRAHTAGAIWRYAGLDNTLAWLGKDGAKEMVDERWDDDLSPEQNLFTIATFLKRRPDSLILMAKKDKKCPICKGQGYIFRNQKTGDVMRSIEPEDETKKSVKEDKKTAKKTIEEVVAPRGWTKEVCPDVIPGEVTKASATSALAKRPWNGGLKTLMWKIGESFVKFQNNRDDIYGKVYQERKALEQQRNSEFMFRPQAMTILASKNYKRDTAAKAAYERGQLPDAHIHARSKRYAVKLFISHWHHVAYESHYNMAPPKPYVIAHGGHTHFLAPPNWPMKG
jgi:hypothetical protein